MYIPVGTSMSNIKLQSIDTFCACVNVLPAGSNTPACV